MGLRVLLLSDTHGFVDPRIAELAGECDWVVHAGDVGNAAVIAELKQYCANVAVARGNNDVERKWPRAQCSLLSALPAEIQIELPGGSLIVVHGDAFAARDRHARLRRAYPQARAILYGHSHHLIVDNAASPWVLNAGAAGRSRTFGGPSCLLLHAGARRWLVEARRFARLGAGH